MQHVQTVLLALVVGEGVRPGLVGVISAVVLPFVAGDGAADGGARVGGCFPKGRVIVVHDVRFHH